MKFYLYMIFDKKIKAYQLQCLKETPEIVEESHKRGIVSLSDKPEALANFKDHSLIIVGSFDDNDGEIKLQKPELVVDFDNILVNLEVSSYEKKD